MGYSVPRCSKLCHYFPCPPLRGKAFLYRGEEVKFSVQEVRVAQIPYERLNFSDGL